MKALALVESPDHVCCRYRIRAFAPLWRRPGSIWRSRPWAWFPRPTSPAPRAEPDRGRADPAEALARLAAREIRQNESAGSSSTSTTRSSTAIPTTAEAPSTASEGSLRPHHERVRRGDRRQRFPRRMCSNRRRGGLHRPGDPHLRRRFRLSTETGRLRASRAAWRWSGSGHRAHSTAWRGRETCSTARARGSRPSPPDDLRPIPGVRVSAGGARSLGPPDRGRGTGPRRRGHHLGARRPLEPRQVRPEGDSVSGRGVTGARQSGRRPHPDD